MNGMHSIKYTRLSKYAFFVEIMLSTLDVETIIYTYETLIN